jgi:hypothetical protein
MLDKKPAEPRPVMVELIVILSPAVLRNPRVPRPSNVEFSVGCMELIDDRKPAVPRPCTVEFKEGCTVDKNPRVPRPSNVEFSVGCMELMLDKKPAVPRPVTVEFRFEVTR